MTEQTLDHWRERMVSALYGEVSAEEMQELEAAMQLDESLRQDWSELHEARVGLRILAEEPVPADTETSFLPPNDGRNRLARRRWLLPAAAGLVGFAAAASVCFVLLLAGLRIDRTGDGLLVRLGGSAAPPPSRGEAQLTRSEMAAYTQLLMEVTDARFAEAEQRQAATQSEVAQALFDALAQRQQYQYDDLRTRIDLAVYHTAANQRSLPSASGRPGAPRPY